MTQSRPAFVLLAFAASPSEIAGRSRAAGRCLGPEALVRPPTLIHRALLLDNAP
jgi:hypothetical protein